MDKRERERKKGQERETQIYGRKECRRDRQGCEGKEEKGKKKSARMMERER